MGDTGRSISSTSDNHRDREHEQFCFINRRQSVWQPFVWQHYVEPGPLPTYVEAHEFSQRGQCTCSVGELNHMLLELACALRNLKKGLRDRSLNMVLSVNYKLRPIVTRVRVMEAAMWPGHPLLPEWKQYSHRIRNDHNYYKRVGRAVETLAWGQALDNHLEARRLHGEAIYCGPRLRDWGRLFWAQPLSLLRTRQERRAIDRTHTRRGAPGNQRHTNDDILLNRARLQIQNVYRHLSAPRMGLWSVLGQYGPLRHAVYQLRVTLQALGFDINTLPARRSQFFLAGGDHGENANAWIRHVDSWWQCKMAQTAFSQLHVIYAVPSVNSMHGRSNAACPALLAVDQ